MPRIRTALAAVSSLALAGLLAAPAHAVPQRTRAEDQVNAFFGQYRDAVLGQTPNQDPLEVRQEFLTTELNNELSQWATSHQADPIFRAQNGPNDWSVKDEGSGAGHTTVILTEDWAGGKTTVVWYQVRLADLRIDGLQDPPA
ncbi:hypothetical protein [Kitasatospora sp. GAS204B]|uniref:hypothetical protein n=1 Tax=unclassified Kitasatospora TaxID=2633591 RepID=UPI002475B783|nr:hypothetical protein [Kitasatospora sp. GAS204B]MDH6116177.1 hypothetical protein [Kitasatospora sp. GAS204B]